MRIMFILPGRGGGGGSHSVVQEALCLHRMGLTLTIASSARDHEPFRATYPELAQAGIANPLFTDATDLAPLLGQADLVIATSAPSASALAQALQSLDEAARPRCGYYIQDYEPLFFSPGTPAWDAARKSYTELSPALLFAKTDWLCALVSRNHNVNVSRVSASLEHATYFPDLMRRSETIHITAMIRPKTPRRAPLRTHRVLERLTAAFGDRVQVASFGCDAEEVQALTGGAPCTYTHLGVLTREAVAATLRNTDLFLDLSDYQAFGRTGLESMACGCAPMLPVFGGASEYARHRENALLVDTRSDEEILRACGEYIDAPQAFRTQMRASALRTAQGYSVERAALSEYALFAEHLS